MSLNLQAIKQALATQLSTALNASSRETTVRPYRTKAGHPCITMQVRDITYFETFGPNGYARVDVDLTVTVQGGDADSEEVVMSDYLSVGVGNDASVVDAVNADPTLGGVVDSCKVLEVGAPADTADGYEAVIPLSIYTKKVGAQA